MPNPNRLRCPQCRTRRTDPHVMVLHRLHCGRPLCHCLAVTFPHRPSSFPACDLNPLAGYFRALLHGATREQADDIALGIAWHDGGAQAVACPF